MIPGFIEMHQAQDVFGRAQSLTWELDEYFDGCWVWFVPGRETHTAVGLARGSNTALRCVTGVLPNFQFFPALDMLLGFGFTVHVVPGVSHFWCHDLVQFLVTDRVYRMSVCS